MVMASIHVCLLLPFTVPVIVVMAGEWNILHQCSAGGNSTTGTLKNFCESWKLNVELNNIRAFDDVPNECTGYIAKYMTTSQYKFDVLQAREQCILYLTLEFVLNGDDRDAWIFDVDSTLLSVVPYYMNHSFGGEIKTNKTDLDLWKAQERAPAVEHVLYLYNVIKNNGLKIFIISSRDEQLRNATVNNLIAAGYYGWTRLILRPSNSSGFETIQSYKDTERMKLTGEGYRLWGVVGDQYSSLLGVHGPKRYFKLPNPMYYEY